MAFQEWPNILMQFRSKDMSTQTDLDKIDTINQLYVNNECANIPDEHVPFDINFVGNSSMQEAYGIIKSFSRKSGWGFIKVENVDEDILFHRSSINTKNIIIGTPVYYQFTTNNKGKKAKYVNVLNFI